MSRHIVLAATFAAFTAACVETTPVAAGDSGREDAAIASGDAGGFIHDGGNTPPDAASLSNDAGATDAGASDAAASDAGTTPSRCVINDDVLGCDYETTILLTGFAGLTPRDVHWQTPLGVPPAAGWPLVILFQGSFFSAELFFSALRTDAFGYWNQGLLTKQLLDAGFVVIAPETKIGGTTAWDTNIPPASLNWDLAQDHAFMLDIFSEIEADTFGDIDEARLYATGISSGGYMTSRMDDAYRERFSALAIAAGSFATCSGVLCDVPDDLDAAHLPTLFLHGADDDVVPLSTMEEYADALDLVGVENQRLIQVGVGHAWIDAAPNAIVDWFTTH